MKFSSIAISFLAIFSLCGFALGETEDPDSIKIGVYLPLTGPNSFGGQLELKGIQLAKEQAPNVINRKVKLIIADNKSDKKEAEKAIKQLIQKDKVVAYIGSYVSSIALVGAKVGEQAHIPGIGTSCTNPVITENKKYFFRACFIDTFQSFAAATYAYNTLNFKKAAVLMDASNNYSTDLSKFFIRSFTKQGGQIVGVQKYNSGDENFSDQLIQLKKNKPDFVFMPAYFAEGCRIIKQARELGCTFNIISSDAMNNPDILQLGSKVIEGFFHTTFPYDITNPLMSKSAKEFTELWKKTFPNQEPNANAALGYICYQLLIEAISKTNSTAPDDIANALLTITKFPTPLGKLTINQSHNGELPVGIIKYENGKRIYVMNVVPE